MKIGDTVKLKPAMWQGIRPESYGLSFTGEYIVSTVYDDQEYPSLRIKGIAGTFDVEAFQLVKEKEVSKFKVGDKVKIFANWVEEEHGTVYTVAEAKEFQGAWIDTTRKLVHIDYVARGYKDAWGDFELVKEETEPKSSLDIQVGGSHYKDKGIQPVEYCYRNNLGFLESNVVKYVSRHKDKNKADDIKKAIHYCKFILEFEYGIVE